MARSASLRPAAPPTPRGAAMRDDDAVDGGQAQPAAETREAFEHFVATRSSGLLRTAYLLTQDNHLAEDLLQTALGKAWRSWARIETHPEAYVRKILVNTYATWWRRKWNGEHPTEELPEPRPASKITPVGGVQRSTSGPRWPGCPSGSGRWSCCASSRTSARPRPRGCSSAASAP